MRCSECPRILPSKKSIAAGIGPGCAAKTGRTRSRVHEKARTR
ncbi:DUF6011 domain-containing protein [Streptomyces sp. NPDC060027]